MNFTFDLLALCHVAKISDLLFIHIMLCLLAFCLVQLIW